MSLDELREEYVGTQHIDQLEDKRVTIVGIDPQLIMLQYEDGTAYDQLIDSPLVNDSTLKINGDAIESQRFVQVGDGGPEIRQACAETFHNFSPTPEEYGITTYDEWTDQNYAYFREAICEDCGLSVDSLKTFTDYEPPTWCPRCDEVIMSSLVDEPVLVFDPNLGGEVTVCKDCEVAIQDEQTCINCGTDVDPDSPTDMVLPPEEPAAQHFGADESREKFVYVCGNCYDDA